MKQKRTRIAGSVVALAAILNPLPSLADETNAIEILSEAQGVLHLTCNTLFETYGTDEDAMLDVVGLMIAVSLNNRGIDFTAMNPTPVETEEIQAEFADEIGDACAEDANALMSGIVDGTVADLVQFY